MPQKLQVGDKAWFMKDNRPTCQEITGIITYEGLHHAPGKIVIRYAFCQKFTGEIDGTLHANDLFPTKQELLESL